MSEQLNGFLLGALFFAGFFAMTLGIVRVFWYSQKAIRLLAFAKDAIYIRNGFGFIAASMIVQSILFSIAIFDKDSLLVIRLSVFYGALVMYAWGAWLIGTGFKVLNENIHDYTGSRNLYKPGEEPLWR